MQKLKIRIEWRLKKYGNKKWSLNFHDQPWSQNPTYCFFLNQSFLSFLGLNQLTTIKENNSSYLCTDHLECSKHFL